MTRPAIAAGLVGVGVAGAVVIGFGLVLAVQALVFLLALPTGLLIGWYANERDRATVIADTEGSHRAPASRGRARLVGNGLLAGLITAVALAAFYVLVRLLFLYLDTGFRAGGAPFACGSGPECGYQRALEEPRVRAALEGAGVRDTAGYTAFFLEGQAVGGAALVVLVLAGALIGSAVHRTGGADTPASTIGAEGPP